MTRKRFNLKGGYQRGSVPTIQEPDNRYYRRHGRSSELAFRSGARKAAIERKLADNPRLVRFHFLHGDMKRRE